MTIDSGWVKILKAGVVKAFSAAPPIVPGAVFIDGQIKLMKGEHIRTCSQFVENQFFHTVDRCFDTGAHTVVLGFDNYAHVPRAKNMTQRKRSQHVPVLDFSDKDELPTLLPDYWDAAMRNRSFKVKVIAMVCEQMRQKYRLTQHRTLILDFTDKLEVLGKERPLPALLATAHEGATRLKRGECDIKAFAYAGAEPLLINSTDGDFVPLSLLQIETALTHGRPEPRIVLYRIKVCGSEDRNAKKRKRGREYEYVDMNAVYRHVKQDLNVERPALCLAAIKV